MRRKHKKHIIKTWILSIAALAVGIVFVSPLYLVFVNSVKTVREIYLSPLGLPVEISWNNFGRVMEKIDFGQALKNSLFLLCLVLRVCWSYVQWLHTDLPDTGPG